MAVWQVWQYPMDIERNGATPLTLFYFDAIMRISFISSIYLSQIIFLSSELAEFIKEFSYFFQIASFVFMNFSLFI